MKKILLFTLFVFGCSLPMLAQSKNDYAQVLQKCIDLKELQAYYPHQTNGTIKQVYILQHGVSFPETTKVTKGGKNVVFVSKQNLQDNNINAYFLFQDFTLTANTATVAFAYQYNRTATQENVMVVNLDLHKTGDTWSIKQSKLEKR